MLFPRTLIWRFQEVKPIILALTLLESCQLTPTCHLFHKILGWNYRITTLPGLIRWIHLETSSYYISIPRRWIPVFLTRLIFLTLCMFHMWTIQINMTQTYVNLKALTCSPFHMGTNHWSILMLGIDKPIQSLSLELMNLLVPTIVISQLHFLELLITSRELKFWIMMSIFQPLQDLGIQPGYLSPPSIKENEIN